MCIFNTALSFSIVQQLRRQPVQQQLSDWLYLWYGMSACRVYHSAGIGGVCFAILAASFVHTHCHCNTGSNPCDYAVWSDCLCSCVHKVNQRIYYHGAQGCRCACAAGVQAIEVNE